MPPIADTAPQPGFDPGRPYRLSPRVGLRPEPFGALAYHYDTRRLVFLKSPDLVDLVRSLGDHATAAEAIETVVAPSPARRGVYEQALASLRESGVVEDRQDRQDREDREDREPVTVPA